ncbi:MAG: signal peptidase I [Pseudobdellovibrio sp.]
MNVKSFLLKHKSTLVMILALFTFRWSFADHYRVPTGSMLPTIQFGDHVFTNKMAYDFKIPFTEISLAHTGEPKRGDVMVFLFPKDESVNFVKRVIGLPGETLKIENNKIYINGTELDETYLPEAARHIIYEHQFEVNIPQDMYFVMGDNRENSLDSRYWGLVPRKNVKGKASGVLWNISFNEIIPSVNLTRIGARL